MLVRDLQWLLAVAETLHVTEAAERLGTSQPTLSRSLARVERELGTALFERGPTGVHLTGIGELAVDRAREVVASHERLILDVASALDPDTGIVRLAFLDSMATSLVPGLLREFHALAPGVRVLLRQEPGHEMEVDLERGLVDLAITNTRVPGRAWHELADERLVLIVPPTHRWATRSRVRLAEVADEEWVTTPHGFAHRALVDSLLRDAGVSPPVSFVSQDLGTIEGLVSAGLGVSVVPEAFIGLTGSHGLELVGAPGARRRIGLTWRGDRQLPGAAERLRAMICGELGGAAAAPESN